MRYISLSKFQARNKITRIIIILLIIFMQNLYEKFYKKKRVILTSSKILHFSIKQYTIRQNLEHVIFERFEFIRYSKLRSLLSSKQIAQKLII